MIDLAGKKFPERVRRVFETVGQGQRLQKTFIAKDTGAVEVTFTYEPSGRRAGPKSAQEAIDSGLLKPLRDGLFGEETSQTWAAP